MNNNEKLNNTRESMNNRFEKMRFIKGNYRNIWNQKRKYRSI